MAANDSSLTQWAQGCKICHRDPHSETLRDLTKSIVSHSHSMCSPCPRSWSAGFGCHGSLAREVGRS